MPTITVPLLFEIDASSNPILVQGETVDFIADVSQNFSSDSDVSLWSNLFHFSDDGLDVSVNVISDNLKTAILDALSNATTVGGGLTINNENIDALANLIATYLKNVEIANVLSTDYSDDSLAETMTNQMIDASAALQSLYEQFRAQERLMNVATGYLDFTDGDTIKFYIKMNFAPIQLAYSSTLLRGQSYDSSIFDIRSGGRAGAYQNNPLGAITELPGFSRIYRLTVNTVLKNVRQLTIADASLDSITIENLTAGSVTFNIQYKKESSDTWTNTTYDYIVTTDKGTTTEQRETYTIDANETKTIDLSGISFDPEERNIYFRTFSTAGINSNVFLIQNPNLPLVTLKDLNLMNYTIIANSAASVSGFITVLLYSIRNSDYFGLKEILFTAGQNTYGGLDNVIYPNNSLPDVINLSNDSGYNKLDIKVIIQGDGSTISNIYTIDNPGWNIEKSLEFADIYPVGTDVGFTLKNLTDISRNFYIQYRYTTDASWVKTTTPLSIDGSVIDPVATFESTGISIISSLRYVYIRLIDASTNIVLSQDGVFYNNVNYIPLTINSIDPATGDISITNIEANSYSNIVFMISNENGDDLTIIDNTIVADISTTTVNVNPIDIESLVNAYFLTTSATLNFRIVGVTDYTNTYSTIFRLPNPYYKTIDFNFVSLTEGTLTTNNLKGSEFSARLQYKKSSDVSWNTSSLLTIEDSSAGSLTVADLAAFMTAYSYQINLRFVDSNGYVCSDTIDWTNPIAIDLTAVDKSNGTITVYNYSDAATVKLKYTDINNTYGSYSVMFDVSSGENIIILSELSLTMFPETYTQIVFTLVDDFDMLKSYSKILANPNYRKYSITSVSALGVYPVPKITLTNNENTDDSFYVEYKASAETEWNRTTLYTFDASYTTVEVDVSDAYLPESSISATRAVRILDASYAVVSHIVEFGNPFYTGYGLISFDVDTGTIVAQKVVGYSETLYLKYYNPYDATTPEQYIAFVLDPSDVPLSIQIDGWDKATNFTYPTDVSSVAFVLVDPTTSAQLSNPPYVIANPNYPIPTPSITISSIDTATGNVTFSNPSTVDIVGNGYIEWSSDQSIWIRSSDPIDVSAGEVDKIVTVPELTYLDISIENWFLRFVTVDGKVITSISSDTNFINTNYVPGGGGNTTGIITAEITSVDQANETLYVSNTTVDINSGNTLSIEYSGENVFWIPDSTLFGIDAGASAGIPMSGLSTLLPYYSTIYLRVVQDDGLGTNTPVSSAYPITNIAYNPSSILTINSVEKNGNAQYEVSVLNNAIYTVEDLYFEYRTDSGSWTRILSIAADSITSAETKAITQTELTNIIDFNKTNDYTTDIRIVKYDAANDSSTVFSNEFPV